VIVETTLLVIGFGNPGRGDDGLGPAFAQEAARWGLPGVRVDAGYQLTVEDAAAAAEHDLLLLADAARTGPAPFALRPVAPDGPLSFSSHSVSPGALLALARSTFGAAPDALLLGIRGYEFGPFVERLSARAAGNLDGALAFIRPVLERRSFAGVSAAGAW
jgi:hydrogenase maturation protease